MVTEVKKEFVYEFTTRGKRSILKVPVQIPLEHTARELGWRLVKAHNLPCFVEEGKHNILCLFFFNSNILKYFVHLITVTFGMGFS